MKPISFALCLLTTLTLGLPVNGQSATEGPSDTPGDAAKLRVVERAQDSAVYQRLTVVTNAEGLVRFQTNHFTLLEKRVTLLRPRSGRVEAQPGSH